MKKNNDSDLVKFTIYDFIDIFNPLFEGLNLCSNIDELLDFLGGKEE